MSLVREVAREVQAFLDMSHELVGVQILEGDRRAHVAAEPHRFCVLESEDLAGAEHTFCSGDLECPGAGLALGMAEPCYVEVEPRIHRSVAAVRVGPLQEADVVLFAVTPRQAMALALLAGGIEAHCTGTHAVCGEVIARVCETGQPHLSLLCQGMREMGSFSDGELVVGIPRERFLTFRDAIARYASLRVDAAVRR
jgi:uncharacterized protein (DUF169 family)